MPTISLEEYKIREGDAYLVNIGTTVPGQDTLTLHMENPDDSDVAAVVTAVQVSSPDGKVIVEQPYDFDVDSVGELHPVDNRARGSSNTSSINVYEGTTYSNVDHNDTSYIGTGTGGAGSVGGAVSDDASNTLLSGSDLIVTVRNPSTSNARDISVTVTYYETAHGFE